MATEGNAPEHDPGTGLGPAGSSGVVLNEFAKTLPGVSGRREMLG